VSLPTRVPVVYFGAFAAVGTAVGALFAYLPLYFRSLGLGLEQIGIIGALAAAAVLVGAPAWGALADHFADSRWPLPASAFTAAVASAWLASAGGSGVIVPVLVLYFCYSGVIPLLDARALELVKEDRHRYGRLRALSSAGFIVSVVFTGWLTDRLGIEAMFLACVPAFLATAIVTASLPGSRRARESRRMASVSTVLRDRHLVFFFAVTLIAWASTMAIIAFFSIRLASLGASGSIVGSAWALGALVEIPFMWWFPALARRFGAERLLVAGSLLLALRALAVGLIDDPSLLVPSMVLAGSGFSLMLVAGVTYVSREAPANAAATAQGVYSATWSALAVIVGSGVGGVLAQSIGIPGMAFVAAATSLVAAGMLAVVTWPSAVRRRAAQPPGLGPVDGRAPADSVIPPE
jgi:MFS transporter, PPP family, 3-phenylpropionic acid transporter